MVRFWNRRKRSSGSFGVLREEEQEEQQKTAVLLLGFFFLLVFFEWKKTVCFRTRRTPERQVCPEQQSGSPQGVFQKNPKRRTATSFSVVLSGSSALCFFSKDGASCFRRIPKEEPLLLLEFFLKKGSRFSNEPLLVVFRQSWILNRVDITQLVRVSDCDSESTGSSPVICPKKWVFLDIHTKAECS